jgi:hypothetical protein
MTSDPARIPPGGPGGRPAPPEARRGNDFLGCLGCLGAVALATVAGGALFLLWVFAFLALSHIYVDAARTITDGDPDGMAAAGWLIFFAAAAGVLVLVLIRGRVPKFWTWTIGALVALLATPAWNLTPTGGSGLIEAASGPGGSGFITGTRWGLAAAAVLLVIAVHVQARNRAKDFYVRHSMLRWAIGTALVFAAATLVTAVVRAG